MSYLLDKKARRNKFLKYAVAVLILFVLIYFHASLFYALSYVSELVFRPVLILGNNISEKLSNAGSYFVSKKSLRLENEDLKLKLSEEENKMSNYNTLLDENLKLKEILGRKEEKREMILAAILSKPNRSPYDTLLIDVGTKSGVSSGQRVFALGNIPIGYVAETYSDSAKIVLYSSPGEKTEVVVSGHDSYIELIGRGGGNFEMIVPRDFTLAEGTEVALPGLSAHILARVETIISDPRDAFQKALLISPVNVAELKFVEVEK